MNQVQEGFFSVEEQMPCSPKEIENNRYRLNSMFTSAEQEEAAARVLFASQELDKWVGISRTKLTEQMRNDYKAFQRDEKIKRHNIRMQWLTRRAVRSYYIRCVLTFGIYALVVRKPAAIMRESVEKVPFSGIYALGFEYVITGLNELVALGMLQCVHGEGSESDHDVFFPTAALVSLIMRE